MIKIEKKLNCSGCTACYSICPVNAIEMIEDNEGFKYPKIDEEKCIKCELCNKICPIESKYISSNQKPKMYAAYSLDEKNKLESSSGGLFTELAKVILKENGVVFGAGYDNDMNVVSKYVEKEEELITLKGSKYVQADMENSYRKIKQFLQEDRKVLFVGTPCQVAGLNKYLQKQYANLYTVDLVCHGVPSPKVYRKYIEAKQKVYKINNISFRDKTKGWNKYSLKIDFKNGKTYKNLGSDDMYIKGFLSNIFLRPSCYDCKFSKVPRYADISLGDFWGVENKYTEFSDDKGTSLILVNNNKGQEIFEKIRHTLYYKEDCDLDYAIKTNPCICGSVKEPEIRKEFFEDIDNLEINKLLNKYIPKQKFLSKVKNKGLTIVRKIIK